ncbi:MAG: D-glucuronyl C5-epimerase family protein, partial [Planctomycetaceae bacterium]
CRHNSTVWWELLIPRGQDVAVLFQMISKKFRGNIDYGRASPLLGIRFLRRGLSLMLILAGGIYLTSLVEYRQSELIVPLRNLWQYGQTSSQSGELLTMSRYKHGAGNNPVHVAQTVRDSALAVIDDVEASKLPMLSTVDRKRLFQVADYFSTSGDRRPMETGNSSEENDTWFRVWAYDFDYPTYGLKQPWYSGMAQGHVIEVELAAYFINGDHRYLDTACEAARALEVPISQGGVAVFLSQGRGIWFEEYASISTEPPLVLNGHNFALNGLWHLSRIEPEFVPLFEAGVHAVKEKLPEFDAGVWSRYDLHQAAANQKYQMIHIDQLRELYARTGEPRFDEYAQKFTSQLWSPAQVCYRLCFYPHRMLVLLLLFNACSVALVAKGIRSFVGRMCHRHRMSRYASDRSLPHSIPVVPLERAA